MDKMTNTNRKLTIKQTKFVNNYLACNNASEAVLQSGYGSKYPDRIAYQLMSKPAVKTAIENARKEIAKSSTITFEMKYNKLWEIVNTSKRDSIKIKAIEVMNAMVGHNAPAQVQTLNVNTTLEKLKALQYKES